MSIQHQKKDDGPSDIMVQKFQEAISKMENMGRQVETFVQTVAFMSNKIETLDTNYEILKQRLIFLVENSRSALGISKDRTDSAISAIESLASKHSDLQQTIQDVRGLFSPIEGKFIKVEQDIKNCPTMGHVIDLYNEVSKIKDTLNLFKDQNSSASSDMIDAHSRLKGLVDALCLDFIHVKKKIEELISYNETHSGFVSVLKSKISDGVASAYKYVDDQLNAKISSLSKPDSITIDDVKKVIDEQFEGVRLDASNAKLRSSNSESKIILLEKKIEQLQLLINKLQMQG